jgi:outer membrane usher protein
VAISYRWLTRGLALLIFSAAVRAVEPAAPPEMATDPGRAEPGPVSEIWLAVLVNGQSVDQGAFMLRSQDGHVWVRGADLRSWRLPVPDAAALTHSAESYYAIDALPGVKYHIDQPQQALIVDAPVSLFDPISIHGTTVAYDTPAVPTPGAYLNYDLVAQQLAHQATLGGLIEASVFGAWGSGTSSFLKSQVSGANQAVRLQTTWTHDQPDDATSLRFGDAITAASQEWGGAVRFGGVQWGTDFATRPGLVTMPLPTLAGESALPSTLDLYVNGALRMRSDAPTGPFVIQDIPALTGDGELRVVVRDMLGREQVITQSFYASPELLRPGLRDFSLELGVVRDNYGFASNDYGRALLVGTDRVGLTDNLTTEVHGEVLRTQQTLGLSGAWLLPVAAVVTGAVAGSHSTQGDGALLVFGLQRTASRLSFGANVQLATDEFTRVGLLPGEAVPSRMIQADMSIALGRFGSLGFIGTRQDFRDSASVELASLRHNIEIPHLGFFSIALTHSVATQSSNSIELTFTHNIDQRTSSSVSAVSQAGDRQGLMQLQRNLPAGDGFGYRLAAGEGDSDDREATLSLRNAVGTYDFDVERLSGVTRTQVGASGGIALFADELFPSRQINGSFAVAEVKDEPGVRVYVENQLVGRTDANGRVLLPDMRPYQDNLVRIEQADLPLDAQISTVEMKAVPYLNSGTVLRFPVVHPHGALIVVHLENGELLPPGALVQIVGHDEAFPSALHGEVYVSNLEENNVLRATWGDRTCEISVPFKATDDPLPKLGPYVCKEVRP